jgi:hypothetical protein
MGMGGWGLLNWAFFSGRACIEWDLVDFILAFDV